MPGPLLVGLALAAAGASAYGGSRASSKIGDVDINSGYKSRLARDYEMRLLRRMHLSPWENPIYNQAMGRNRREVRSVTSRTEQQIKDSMPDGKARDQLLKQVVSLRRGEMEALSGSATDMILKLEMLRDQGVFQYLQGESQDLLASSGLRLKQGVEGAAGLQRGIAGTTGALDLLA